MSKRAKKRRGYGKKKRSKAMSRVVGRERYIYERVETREKLKRDMRMSRLALGVYLRVVLVGGW